MRIDRYWELGAKFTKGGGKYYAARLYKEEIEALHVYFALLGIAKTNDTLGGLSSHGKMAIWGLNGEGCRSDYDVTGAHEYVDHGVVCVFDGVRSEHMPIAAFIKKLIRKRKNNGGATRNAAMVQGKSGARDRI